MLSLCQTRVTIRFSCQGLSMNEFHYVIEISVVCKIGILFYRHQTKVTGEYCLSIKLVLVLLSQY